MVTTRASRRSAPVSGGSEDEADASCQPAVREVAVPTTPASLYTPRRAKLSARLRADDEDGKDEVVLVRDDEGDVIMKSVETPHRRRMVSGGETQSRSARRTPARTQDVVVLDGSEGEAPSISTRKTPARMRKKAAEVTAAPNIGSETPLRPTRRTPARRTPAQRTPSLPQRGESESDAPSVTTRGAIARARALAAESCAEVARESESETPSMRTRTRTRKQSAMPETSIVVLDEKERDAASKSIKKTPARMRRKAADTLVEAAAESESEAPSQPTRRTPARRTPVRRTPARRAPKASHPGGSESDAPSTSTRGATARARALAVLESESEAPSMTRQEAPARRQSGDPETPATVLNESESNALSKSPKHPSANNHANVSEHVTAVSADDAAGTTKQQVEQLVRTQVGQQVGQHNAVKEAVNIDRTAIEDVNASREPTVVVQLGSPSRILPPVAEVDSEQRSPVPIPAESPLPATGNEKEATKTVHPSSVLNGHGLTNTEYVTEEPISSEELFSQAVAKPEMFLARDRAISNLCRAVMRDAYLEQSAAEFGAGMIDREFAPQRRGKKLPPLGPLMRLEAGEDFDCEQLWEEVELRNRPLTAYMHRAIRTQVALEQERHLKERQGEKATATEVVGVKDSRDIDDSAARDPVHLTGGTDDVIDNGGVNGSTVANGLVDGDASDSSDDDGNLETVERDSSSQKRVRFEDDVGDDKDTRNADDQVDLEDGFLNIADMEAFADEAEHLALQGKLIASDDEEEAAIRANDSDPDADEDGIVGRPRVKNANARIRYEDFFDPPQEDDLSGEAARALRRAEMFDGGSDESSDDEQEPTPLETSRAKMRATIEAIEEANTGKKPWQLRGEVVAHARPKDSLLDADLEHDIAARPRLIVTPETTESVEELIRQRIFDRLYDDVVSILPVEYEEAKRKKKKDAPEVSQEKAGEGLGDLYAREFVEQREKVSKAADAAGLVKKDEDPAETVEQVEVNKLYKRLCIKLDSLASLHFTPSTPKASEEMEVKPNAPALAAEEAIPEAVSDGALLAPREVHVADKKELQGEVETTTEERRRRRRSKKRQISNQNQAHAASERAQELADPVLGEKRRAERALERRGKKTKKIKNVGGGRDKKEKSGDFSKSNRFFARMQESGSGGTGDGEGGENGTSSKRVPASHYVL